MFMCCETTAVHIWKWKAVSMPFAVLLINHIFPIKLKASTISEILKMGSVRPSPFLSGPCFLHLLWERLSGWENRVLMGLTSCAFKFLFSVFILWHSLGRKCTHFQSLLPGYTSHPCPAESCIRRMRLSPLFNLISFASEFQKWNGFVPFFLQALPFLLFRNTPYCTFHFALSAVPG